LAERWIDPGISDPHTIRIDAEQDDDVAFGEFRDRVDKNGIVESRIVCFEPADALSRMKLWKAKVR
jgi:hypothetical protein